MQDVRNNSAWNQRHFAIKYSDEGFSSDIVRREVEYTKEKIKIVVNNESAWNYLEGLEIVSIIYSYYRK